MGVNSIDDSPVVSVSGLTKQFGDKRVLDAVDFDLAPGEFVSILGRSGTGKSTFLRLVSSLDGQLSQGTISVTSYPGIMFQDARLLPWLSAGANVALGSAYQGDSLEVVQMFDRVGLDRTLIDAWPRTLSGGQAQRVALARALLAKPSFLVLDEPFGALDSLTRIRMQDLLIELRHRYRPAVLLVTHDVEEALVLSDKVLVLADGRFAHEQRIDLPYPRSRSDNEIVRRRCELLNTLT